VLGGALTIGIYTNFEAFDFIDVKIITNCRLNKLYFMQYYTELYISAENPDLLVNKKLINNINAKALFFFENVDHVPDFQYGICFKMFF
jgi:hypothetical protein